MVFFNVSASNYKNQLKEDILDLTLPDGSSRYKEKNFIVIVSEGETIAMKPN